MREAVSPLPQYVFMAFDLVKHGDNFTFTFASAPNQNVMKMEKAWS
jgi:hypothetical protein